MIVEKVLGVFTGGFMSAGLEVHFSVFDCKT